MTLPDETVFSRIWISCIVGSGIIFGIRVQYDVDVSERRKSIIITGIDSSEVTIKCADKRMI